jgi:hypothetical protein
MTMELYDVMRTTFAAREFTDDPLLDPILCSVASTPPSSSGMISPSPEIRISTSTVSVVCIPRWSNSLVSNTPGSFSCNSRRPASMSTPRNQRCHRREESSTGRIGTPGAVDNDGGICGCGCQYRNRIRIGDVERDAAYPWILAGLGRARRCVDLGWPALE